MVNVEIQPVLMRLMTRALLLAATLPVAALLAYASPAADASLAGCPVTAPVNPIFTPPDPYPSKAPGQDRFWYGDERLWTSIPRNGRWAQLAAGEKVFWWNEHYDWISEPVPDLVVTARRLDVAMDIVEFRDATNSFHESFRSAMLIGITLPTYGCWEITGHYRRADLTFVVAVSASDK